LDGTADKEDLKLAAQIVARFSQGRDAEMVEVEVTDKDGVTQMFSVKPLLATEIEEAWRV
ncbi:MAG: hypothetical protein RPR98_03430, partial [Bermanella sp.]